MTDKKISEKVLKGNAKVAKVLLEGLHFSDEDLELYGKFVENYECFFYSQPYSGNLGNAPGVDYSLNVKMSKKLGKKPLLFEDVIGELERISLDLGNLKDTEETKGGSMAKGFYYHFENFDLKEWRTNVSDDNQVPEYVHDNRWHLDSKKFIQSSDIEIS